MIIIWSSRQKNKNKIHALKINIHKLVLASEMGFHPQERSTVTEPIFMEIIRIV